MQDFLGGNSRITMIACINPAADTLKFAEGASKVRNKAMVNEAAVGQGPAFQRASDGGGKEGERGERRAAVGGGGYVGGTPARALQGVLARAPAGVPVVDLTIELAQKSAVIGRAGGGGKEVLEEVKRVREDRDEVHQQVGELVRRVEELEEERGRALEEVKRVREDRDEVQQQVGDLVRRVEESEEERGREVGEMVSQAVLEVVGENVAKGMVVAVEHREELVVSTRACVAVAAAVGGGGCAGGTPARAPAGVPVVDLTIESAQNSGASPGVTMLEMSIRCAAGFASFARSSTFSLALSSVLLRLFPYSPLLMSSAPLCSVHENEACATIYFSLAISAPLLYLPPSLPLPISSPPLSSCSDLNPLIHETEK
ncbi:unnamed protein product [Closterium sp. NIES-64]|nr:unnamed protein product [Closterium sp. NIES-64]